LGKSNGAPWREEGHQTPYGFSTHKYTLFTYDKQIETTNTKASEANSLIENVAQKKRSKQQTLKMLLNKKMSARLILRSECSNNTVTTTAQFKQQKNHTCERIIDATVKSINSKHRTSN